jgi:hypothetical protein
VAEIDVPAIEYDTETEGEGEEMVQKTTPLPLDMDKVVLTLWSIDDKEKIKEV